MSYTTSFVRAMVFFVGMLASVSMSFAQAYVNQANGNNAPGVYVNQMPDGIKPAYRAPPKGTRSARRSTPASSPAQATAVVLPSVAAGSTAIVKLESADSEWPTVGRGTVRR